MLRRIFFRFTALFTALILLSSAVSFTTSHAQYDTPWMTWLYDADSGMMYLVSTDGLVEEFILPLPDGYDTRPYSNVAVSPNGQIMAYPVRNATSFAQALVVYNHTTRSILATYAPGTLTYNSLEFTTRHVFSSDSTALAFGYGYDTGDWEVVVIDIATLSLRGVLRSGDSAAIGLPIGPGLIPTPVHYRNDNRVALTFVLGGTDAYDFDSFLWTPETNAHEPTIAYRFMGVDVYQPTSEVIFAHADDRLPSRPDLFPMLHINSLQVFTPATGERFPFYAPADGYAVYAPRFIWHGERIAALETIPLDSSSASTAVVVVERSGTPVARIEPPPLLQIIDLEGTPSGLIYVQQHPDLSMTLHHVRVEPATHTDTTIWASPTARNSRIAWVGNMTEPGLPVAPAYTPWAQLAPPITGSGTTGGGEIVVEPVEAVLHVGGTAVIRTTEGDQLNMRSAAGTQFAIVEKLSDGAQVEVLEGPVSASDFTWWRVRAPSGQAGWVVEYADNEQTLVATGGGTGGELDERESGGADPGIRSLLAVGQDAIVTLTERRDALRLRNAAGIEGRVISLLPNGTRVRVIDGPRQLDNFSWWQIRTPEGNVGWAAEIVGGERTLTPAP